MESAAGRRTCDAAPAWDATGLIRRSYPLNRSGGTAYRDIVATRASSRPGTPIAFATAALLALLAAYGLWSMPGLATRWGLSSAAPIVLLGWLAAAALAVPLYREASNRAAIAACVGIAIALRVAAALLVIGRIPGGDAANYPILAEHVRAGQGLWLFDPYMGEVVRGLYPPLYPVLLAGWSGIAGLSTASLSVLSLIVDGAAAVAVARLGAAIGRPAAGRAAGWLYLIWPATLFSAPLAQKEGLCALLIVSLALQWIAAARDPSRVRIAAIGLLAGLLALTQPGEAPLAALFGLAIISFAGWRRVLRIGVPAAGVAALVMAPWWVRNAVVFHRFVPLTSAGGYGLWIGNNPGATGNWMPPPAAWRGLPEIAFGTHAAAVARAWIVAHPIDFARLSVTKALRTLGVAQAGLVRMAAMHPAPAPGVLAALLPLAESTHIALLAVGAWGARAAGRSNAILLALVLACFVQMLGFGLWFEFAERHREFATPFLLLLAIAGLERLPRWRAGLPQRAPA